MRGKHGQAAAVRHEVQSRDAEIATYQRAVARLTAENRELKEKLETERQVAARTQRELRERLSAGAAPEVEALQIKLREVTNDRDAAKAHVREFGRQTDAASEILEDIYVGQGLKDRDAAIERVYEIMPLRTGDGIGKPDLVMDMRGQRSVAADGRMIGTEKLRVRAANGDQAALEEYRRLRNSRVGKSR